MQDEVTAADLPPAKQGDLLREIGSGGPSILSGLITDDEEHNSKLRGIEGVLLFDRMRRSDAQAAALLAALAQPLLSAERVIDRPEDDEKAAEQVTDEHLDFARHNLFARIDFDEVLLHVLSAFWAGYSWFEKVYVVEAGKLMLDRLAPRLASTLWRWEADDKGQITGVTQRARIGGQLREIKLPRNKLAIFTVGKEAGDPGGRSILRAAYKSYKIKDTLYKLEAIRFERYAVGVPVIKLPDPYTDDQLTMAKEITKNWRGAEQSHVVLVGDMTVELMQAKGSDALDIQPAIRHHNEEMAKSVLAQFINLGTTDTGSRALGESMIGFFYDAVGGHAKAFAAQLNREVLWPTMDLNFPGKPRPMLRFEDLGSVSLGQLADGLQKLQAFIQPDMDAENYVRRRYGLPVRMGEQALKPPAKDGKPEGETLRPMGRKVVLVEPAKEAFWRPLRPEEGFVRLRLIDARLQEGKDTIVAELLGLREEIADSLVVQIRKRWREGPKGLAFVEIGVPLLAKTAGKVLPELAAIYQFGREEVGREIERQANARGKELKRKRGNIRTATILADQAGRMLGRLAPGLADALEMRDEGLTPEEVKELARFRSGELATRLSRKVQDAALAIAAGRWRTEGGEEPSEEAIVEILRAVFDSVEREAQLVANVTASEMLNLGRDFEAQRLKEQIEVAIYSAVLDTNSCENCRAADGEEAQVGTPEYYDLMPPLNSREHGPCQGGGQCRCIWVYIFSAQGP